jgi:hypothetical protein
MMDEDTVRALVAAIDRDLAARKDLTPEQRAAVKRYYEVLDEVYLLRSAPKRKQGHGDCSEELAAAEREALQRVRAELRQADPGLRGLAARLVGQPIRVVARPRERKAQRSSKSSSSSSGEDDLGDEPPPWLPGHGDVEGVGDPPPDPIPDIALRVWWGAWIDSFGGFEVAL